MGQRLGSGVPAKRVLARVALVRTHKMPKVKTNKTAAKRFKITGTGKLMHRHARVNHLMICKRKSRRRRLGMDGQVVRGEAKKIRRMLQLGPLGS